MRRQKESKGQALKYETVVDLSDRNNSQTLLVLLTGENKDVLEIGPAQGYMTKVLQERGCKVTAVELDPAAAKLAEPYCERMIIGDVEQLNLGMTFPKERFGVVIFGDVLEHLVDPEHVLAEIATLLEPGGYVVASIPNVAHGSVRLALLSGEFPYTEVGLLDSTHLRFFTRRTIEELFANAGFDIQKWENVLIDPFETELRLEEKDFPAYLVDQLRQDPEALVYQYVVKAEPDPSVRPRHGVRSAESSVVSRLRDHIAMLENQLTEKDRELQRKDGVIAKRDARLAGRDRTIRALEATIGRQEAAIEDKDSAISDKELRLEAAMAQYEVLTTTIGYRALELARWRLRRLAPPETRRRSIVNLIGHAADVLVSRGVGAFFSGLLKFWKWMPRLWKRAPVRHQEPPKGPPETLPMDEQYQLWLQREALTDDRRRELERQASQFNYRPKLSIVTPVYNTDPRWLSEAIDSVRRQLYDNWELCLADDGSTQSSTQKVLRRYRRRDRRIKVTRLDANQGIAAASNAGLAIATGEFVALLDHDDELKEDALFEVVKLLNERRDLDFIYSDEDKKDMEGRLVEPFFKPAWSPDLLMSVNYVTHFSVYRKEILDQVGGFRVGYDGSQDYDLVLRVSELTDRIGHIPRPLYSWRKVAGSAAASLDAKQYAYDAGTRALKDALQRRGYQGDVKKGLVRGRYRVRYAIKGSPKITVIIPTRDRVDMLRRCVESIKEMTTYKNYEIVIVDNESSDEETLEYLHAYEGTVIPYPYPFNYAKIMNTAARQVTCDALLFLNNDTEVLSREWMEAMLEHGQRPEVAVVGARLVYRHGRVQHEGIVMGFLGGSAGNVDHGGFFALGETIRNCSAVTGACMLTRPEVYWELGGLDETLGVAFNDVDFCLRAREKGYQIVYTPYALLKHHESATRGRLHPDEDEAFFRKRWGNPGEFRDPYYNPNLDLIRPFNIRL
jgi:glycosyltransferase involved in cell wall biosynthesis/2-polyprenyl-3-methyl-5-hydroxy-6-metoxy-1,4-benzoquinol methylase